MIWVEIAALTALLAVLAAALLTARRVRRASTVLDAATAQAEARAEDQAERIAAMDELRENRELAEQLLGTGSSIAHTLHQSLGDLPLPILSNLPETARVARELHQNISRDIGNVLTLLGKKFKAPATSRELNEPPGDDPGAR
ncbi:MAG: hypothetical protein EPN72_11455 [Nevskiaceae bacterium]|nr:MAG: hypothetical protein EPN63_01525 [Nevskiaceae bacterium]TBR71813.1 MAG: hypothetical protein EPN72_11455 [Nevskiaceae bacterium]